MSAVSPAVCGMIDTSQTELKQEELDWYERGDIEKFKKIVFSTSTVDLITDCVRKGSPRVSNPQRAAVPLSSVRFLHLEAHYFF